jgi:hypothetical protein
MFFESGSGGGVRRERSMIRLVLTVSLVALLFTLSVVEAHAQNVAQVDATGGVSCPVNGVVGDVPGLNLSLETTGNPVLIIYTVQFIASPTGSITLLTVIDGVTQTSGQRDRSIGDLSGQTADVTFSRVYPLARGQHTFGLRATCHSGVEFSTSWLTVYELPKSKNKRGDESD